MFEMLLTTGNKLYLPWSGPGNKKIIKGNKELGFFGQVTAQELMSYPSFFAQVAPKRGVQPGYAASAQTWFKFIYKGKVLFVPRYFIATSLSWEDLYAAGAVYGVRGPGALPIPNGNPVDQVKLLTVSESLNGGLKTWPLKVRLFDGANGNATLTADYPTDQTEWDVIWDRFFTEKWDNSNWQGLNNGYANMWSFIQERTSDGSYAGIRGGSNNYQSKNVSAVSSASSSFNWRPVIELVRGDDIAIPVYALSSAISSDALTSVIPSFSVDMPKPYLKGIRGLVGVSTYLRDLSVQIETTIPVISWNIAGAKYGAAVTLDNDAPLIPVANVSGYRSRLLTPATPITTTIPQVMGNTSPVTDRRLTTTFDNDAPLTPVSKIVAVRTQLKAPLVTTTGARPEITWKTPGTVTLLPPTFESVEPDDLASAFSNNQLNGFDI